MWRQLRWRLVGAQMVVVLVGVIALALSVQVALARLPQQIQNALVALAPEADPKVLSQAADAVTQGMQGIVFQSLLIAAVAATLAGLVATLLLMREILDPLREIARNSERIANGHYDERVAVPAVDELALVAVSFNQMAESLAEVEEQRVQMIGNVAHELRTPLTGLRGYLEGLLDGLFPAESETFGSMAQEVHRLERLVDDLQALSRVEAGQFELAVEPFDLLPVVDRVVRQLSPQALSDELTLTLDTLPEPVVAYADVDRTAQILINVIGNAIRYSEAGDTITVHVQSVGRAAQVTVVDTGMGLSTEDQRHIFDRFYRADRSRSHGGSGIGLTISRHFAWSMGGDLVVASDGVGQGSTFTLTLPLAT